ncbi:MAG: hypothetical protein DRQ13_12730, partial [Ignavibacteriae bacterium]
MDRSSSPVYDSVSLIYEELMRDVNYKKWSKYLLDVVIEYLDNKESFILYFGPGNCRFARHLSKTYHNIIASDLSLPMLQNAQKLFIS